jgi:hypothetical protein
MTTLKRYSFLLLTLVLISCAQVEEKEEVYQEEIFIENSGFFRGYKLGCLPDSVLAAEKWIPVVSNDSTIEYHEEVVLLDDTFMLNAYLAFDTYGLFEVQVDVFTNDDTLSNSIIENWSTRLTDPFGEYESILTSRRWTTFSQSNSTIEITLSQEQNNQRKKFISLNYLEPLNDEY